MPKVRGLASEGRGVQSVEIGMRLLTALATHQRPMMLKDLAAAAGLVAAQAHPYLVSFRQQEMVVQDAVTGRYRLGRFALELGIARMSAVDPIDVAYDAMRGLSNETGLSVILSVWGSFGPTIVHIVEGTRKLYMSSRVGTVYSLSGTATGLIFAAHLPDAQTAPVRASEKRQQDQKLRVGVPGPIPKAVLAQVRAQGYAEPSTPVVPGVVALAAPIFDLGGQLQFAMALVGREGRGGADQIGEMREALLSRAMSLSMQLGFAPELASITNVN